MSKPLQQYKGALSIEQIADGMNCAAKNAERLLADAELLLNHGCYASAASLAALSIEECGKVVILRRFLRAENDDDRRKLWKEYRSHTRKNVNWIVADLAAHGARKLEDFRPIVDPSSDHPEVLDCVKQLGFYTDCLGAGKWSIPNDVIDESLCRQLIRSAEILLPKRKVTVKELELWQKHMTPIWMKDTRAMQGALVAWYADMQAQGLMPKGQNAMEIFIRDGLSQAQAADLAGDA